MALSLSAPKNKSRLVYQAVSALSGTKSPRASPLIVCGLRIVVPAARGPDVHLVAESGKLVHDAPLARVVLVLPLHIGEAIVLFGRKADAVLPKLRFTKRLELFLGGEPFAILGLARFADEDAPGLLEVVQEKDEQRIRKRKRQRPAKRRIKGVEVAGIVHAVGHMVEVAAIPRLVVVRRAPSPLKKRAVVSEDALAGTSVGFVDLTDEIVDGSVVEGARKRSHGIGSFQRTVASVTPDALVSMRTALRYNAVKDALILFSRDDEFAPCALINSSKCVVDKEVGARNLK